MTVVGSVGQRARWLIRPPVSAPGRALHCETSSRTSPLRHMHATPDPGRPARVADIVKRAVITPAALLAIY
jgi:hypothetical protein